MNDMSNAAVTSVKGSFLLFMGNSVALLVNAVGAFLVTLMLSPSDYGLYSISLILPSFFILFTDWGINPALIQLIASSGNQNKNIGGYQEAGFIFKFLTGGTLTFVLWMFSGVLSSALLGRPEVVDLVRLASLAILFQSLHQTSISVLTGYEQMGYRSVVSVSQSLIKGIGAPLLVYYGYGVSGAIIGHVFSYAIAACVGFLLSFYSKKGIPLRGESIGFRNGISHMLGYGLPLFLGNVAVGLTASFRSFLMPWFVSNEIIGNYGVASRFMSLVGLVTQSIGVTLFPAFSKFNYNLEPEKTKEVFMASVKYSSMIILPFTILLASISEPLIYTLYNLKYPLAPFFFLLLLTPKLLVGVGSLSIGSFLNSQGVTRGTMKIRLVDSVFLILLSPVMVWMWGIPGLILSVLISNLASNILGLHVLRDSYNLFPDLVYSGRVILCSLLSAGSSMGVKWVLNTGSPVLDLIAGSTVFILSFLVFAPVLRVIKNEDIENFESTSKDLGIIFKVIRIILDFEKIIIKHTRFY